MSSSSPTPVLADGNIDTNAEPQLKFEALHGDLDRILQDETISCLCLSDKILTLGTEEGRVHVLDYCGNQVRCFVLHKARVNELSIDVGEECVASCSDDGSVFVMGLCGDLSLKHEHGKPVKAIAIDPRFATRKTKEFVAVNEAGVVQLSTQGWLGRSDYALGGHMAPGVGTVVGKAQVVRWWKDLVAWASDSALVVYCMLQHRLICTIRRPKLASPQAPASGGAAQQGCKPSLLFGQNSHVYVSWPDCVKVVRVSTVMSAASTFTKAEQVCDLRLPDHLMAMGLSPFGRDLALLTIPSQGTQACVQDQQEQHSEGSSPQQETPDSSSPQLRIITHKGAQLAVDSLPLPLLPPPRPRTPPPPSTPQRAGQPSQPPTQQPPPLPCFQLVPSLPSTTTEATTSYSWSRGLSALASLPAYATATAASAVGAAAAVGSSGVMLSASAGPLPHGTPGESDHQQQQQQQQGQQQGQKQGGPGRLQGDGGLPAGHHPGPRGVAGSGEQGALHQHQQLVEGSGPLDAGAANELLTFFIVSPKMVYVAHPRDANDRVLWLIEVGRFEEALDAAEDGLRASHGLTNGDIAEGKDNGMAPGGLSAGDNDEGQGPGVGSYGVTRETYDKAVQAFIGWLLSSGSFERAASMSWRLLGRSAPAWERWVYLFAQARHLPLLAPHLPTESPRLRSGLYDIVLASLLSQPEHHATALKLVRSWPPSLFSMPQLMEAVASRMKRPGGESRELALIMAELYERQARPDLALATYLNLREPRALELLEAGAGPAGRGAAALLAPRQTGADAATAAAAAAAGGVVGPAAVAALLELNEDRALDALVRHVETLPPAHVVDALQEAELNCASDDSSTPDGSGARGESKRKHDAAQRLRKSLWRYLAAVMAQEPTALSPQHAHLAIVLAAEYAPPGKLLDMLSGSGGAGAPLIPLESALAVCEEHNMVAEQVYLLGRMGNASRALHLIIDKLEDIPQAIEFVRGQRDDELWEQLMSWALGSPETTGALLDHIGGHINPLSIIRRLPSGTSIPRLRDRVISIITDFRTQTSLHEGCNTILRADCAHLMTKFYASIRAQVPTVYIKCSSWHALKHHQNLRRLVGASSHNNTLHAGAGGVWLRYGAPMAMGTSPASNPHQVLQPLVGPQDLPQGLLPAMQHSTGAGIDEASTRGSKYQPGLGAAFAHAGRQDGSAHSQRAWVGCIAPDVAAAEDALATTPTGSTTRATAYGASSNPRTKGAIKRQQRQHAYLHPRFPSSSSTAELPALVHMS